LSNDRRTIPQKTFIVPIRDYATILPQIRGLTDQPIISPPHHTTSTDRSCQLELAKSIPQLDRRWPGPKSHRWRLQPRQRLYLTNDRAPKVFLSHASEDKERFVIRFATELRNNGVNVWLDKWEILLGDSLIDSFTSPLEWQLTAAPVPPPLIPVMAERGGTQLKTHVQFC
jgi:hypothetical protein